MQFGDHFVTGNDNSVDELNITWTIELGDDFELASVTKAVGHVKVLTMVLEEAAACFTGTNPFVLRRYFPKGRPTPNLVSDSNRTCVCSGGFAEVKHCDFLHSLQPT
jgi:hypothetical protein